MFYPGALESEPTGGKMKRLQIRPGVYISIGPVNSDESLWKVYVLGSLAIIGMLCLLPVVGLVWLYKKLAGKAA